MYHYIQPQNTLYKIRSEHRPSKNTCSQFCAGHILNYHLEVLETSFLKSRQPSLCKQEVLVRIECNLFMKICLSWYIIDKCVFSFSCFLFNQLCTKHLTLFDQVFMSEEWQPVRKKCYSLLFFNFFLFFTFNYCSHFPFYPFLIMVYLFDIIFIQVKFASSSRFWYYFTNVWRYNSLGLCIKMF